MCKVSTLDHLSAKVDTLFQKIDKLNVSVVTPTPVSPPCEVCGILVILVLNANWVVLLKVISNLNMLNITKG